MNADERDPLQDAAAGDCHSRRKRDTAAPPGARDPGAVAGTTEAPMELPFDGAISRYAETEAPAWLRERLARDADDAGYDPDFPYRKRMKGKDYRADLDALQIELVRYQAHLHATGERVAVIFEGRDAAGKGSAIARLTANLNPRVARIVALPRPSDTEASQWYFQRYTAHLPAAGEIAIFDRSWYNRGVVEHVFGFCTHDARERFFEQVPRFEAMLVEDGIRLIKIWLNIGRAEQLRRFVARERDPLKQWKLSRIDVEGLAKWDAYSVAIRETLARSHTSAAPWNVIRADDKRRARLAAIRAVLAGADYPGRGPAAGGPDPAICGGPEIWND